MDSLAELAGSVEKVCIVNHILRKGNLLVGLLVHKVETVLFSIEELVRTSLNVDGLNLCTCGESVLEYTSVLEVAKFGLHESRTLARLHVLEPYD